MPYVGMDLTWGPFVGIIIMGSYVRGNVRQSLFKGFPIDIDSHVNCAD